MGTQIDTSGTFADDNLSVKEAVDFCHLPKTTLYAAVATSELPIAKIGRLRLIACRGLIAWLNHMQT